MLREEVTLSFQVLFLNREMMVERMQEVFKQLEEWDYLQKLWEEKSGYKKILPSTFENQDGKVDIFFYENVEIQSKISGRYDFDTSDFMLCCTQGYHVYHDIRFICKNIKEYEKRLDQFLEMLLDNLTPEKPREAGFFMRRKELVNWRPAGLEEKIGNFTRYIQPPNFFGTVNGAVVVLDYSDFSQANQFSVFYNKMRDDFYAERRVKGELQQISEFDCKTLDELDEIIKTLPEILEKIEQLSADKS